MNDYDDDNELVPSILNNHVSMSNVAARAAHSLTLTEKKLVSAAVSMLDSSKNKDHYTSVASRSFKITAADYMAISDSKDNKGAYRDLIRGSDRLLNRQIIHPRNTPKGTRITKINWLGKAEYHEGEGWVELTITQESLPYFVELQGRYTSYRLDQAAALRSLYSWRLLEVLTSWSRKKGKVETGNKEVSIDELRDILEIPDSYKWVNIRQRVIQPSVEELSKKDGWQINWDAIKTGRKVTSIKFNWERSSQFDLFRDDKSNPGVRRYADGKQRMSDMPEDEHQQHQGEEDKASPEVARAALDAIKGKMGR